MGFTKKGEKRPPNAGRRAGTPNKSTNELRFFLKAFCEQNAGKMQEWLDRVAKTDPLGALKALTDLFEYCQPKLQRTELIQTPNSNDADALTDEQLEAIATRPPAPPPPTDPSQAH